MSLDELANRNPPKTEFFRRTVKRAYKWGLSRPPQDTEDSMVLSYEAAIRQNRDALLQHPNLNPKVREYIEKELK